MKKKIIALILFVFLCLVPYVPTYAESDNGTPRLVDDADLLSDSEEKQIKEELDRISEKYKCDVIIITVDSLNGKDPNTYAEDFFIDNGFGIGSRKNKSGIVFLISMEYRDWAIATTGKRIIKTFTDSNQNAIIDNIYYDLSHGNYYEAFDGFIDECSKYLNKLRTKRFFAIPISIVVGFIISFIVMSSVKSKLKTVRKQPEARSYLVDNSLIINEKRDQFLYSNVRKVARQTSSSSGGSSTHTHSSGTTFGGSHGKF